MKYLVMECRTGYAVVLDEQGQFLKVPNRGYAVGQTVEQVTVLPPVQKPAPARRLLLHWAAAAACLCLMILGSWNLWRTPTGTVRITINPDVQLTVNLFDRVVDLQGLNQDGKDLIVGYSAYGKSVETVSDELADLAMAQSYLQPGGRITLTVDSSREQWKVATEEKLLLELEIHLDHSVEVVFAAVPLTPETTETSDAPSLPEDTALLPGASGEDVTPTVPPQTVPRDDDDDDDDRDDHDDPDDEDGDDEEDIDDPDDDDGPDDDDDDDPDDDEDDEDDD